MRLQKIEILQAPSRYRAETLCGAYLHHDMIRKTPITDNPKPLRNKQDSRGTGYKEKSKALLRKPFGFLKCMLRMCKMEKGKNIK